MTSTPFKQDPNSETTNTARTDEIDLGQLIGLLLDRWRRIASLTFLLLIAGLIYALSATPIYQSDALVQIEEEDNGLDIGAMLGGDLGTTGSSTKAEIEIIQSRMVLGEAVDRASLDIEIIPNRMPLIGNLLNNFGFESGPVGIGSGYNWAGSAITVTRFEVPAHAVNVPHKLQFAEDNSFELSVDGIPVLKGKVGRQATGSDSGYRLFVQTKTGKTSGSYTIKMLDRLTAIETLRKRLQVTERGKDTGILSVKLESDSRKEATDTLQEIVEIFLKQNVERLSEEAERQLVFLDKQIPEVRKDLESSENNLNEYRERNDSVDLTFETQSILSQLVAIENQLTELEFAEAELSQQFTKNHPRYEALLTKRQSLEKEIKRLEKQVSQLPTTQQEVLRLTRDAQVNQEIFVALLNSRQEMNLVKAGTIGNIRILDPAATMPKPIKPRKPLIVILATLLGAILGIGNVLIARALHRGIENPDQLEQIGLPVYASVPISKSALVDRVIRTGLSSKDRDGQRKNNDLIAVNEPADPVVEAIRGLRTSLHFGLLESANNRILLTGSSPGVGKSFIASNLAVTIAQSGQKVLLIDTDLRKGRVHKIFDLEKAGLTEVLGKKMQAAEAVRKIPGIKNLDIMPRGDTPPNPSELLMTPGLGDLFEWASINYDIVIVDSPPVLAVTDAVIVGQLCGIALMIARFSETAVKEMLVSSGRLRQNGVSVKGSILNAVEKRASSYYGYGGYYNYDYRKTKDD